MKFHQVKASPEWFDKYSEDTWSIRNNDRDYQINDLFLVSHVHIPDERHLHEIQKVHHNVPGLKDGYVMLELKLLKEYY